MGKVRLLMRREKTMKICANFFVAPTIVLKENAGSDRSWVWQCNDFSEEKTEISTLAIRFANSDNAQKFKEAFVSAMDTNKAVLGDAPLAAATEEKAAGNTDEKKPTAGAAFAEEKTPDDAEKKVVDVE